MKKILVFLILVIVALPSIADDGDLYYYILGCNVYDDDGNYIERRISNILVSSSDNNNGRGKAALRFFKQVTPPEPSDQMAFLSVDDPNFETYSIKKESLEEAISHAQDWDSEYLVVIPGASLNDDYFYNAIEEIDVTPYIR